MGIAARLLEPFGVALHRFAQMAALQLPAARRRSTVRCVVSERERETRWLSSRPVPDRQDGVANCQCFLVGGVPVRLVVLGTLYSTSLAVVRPASGPRCSCGGNQPWAEKSSSKALWSATR